MREYFWPDEPGLRERTQQAWSATVESLPVGTHVTGKVIGRQPFGVFIMIDQTPDSVGLVRSPAFPRNEELPLRDERISGQVLWHEPSNCQVIVTPFGIGDTDSDHDPAISQERFAAIQRTLGGE